MNRWLIAWNIVLTILAGIALWFGANTFSIRADLNRYTDDLLKQVDDLEELEVEIEYLHENALNLETAILASIGTVDDNFIILQDNIKLLEDNVLNTVEKISESIYMNRAAILEIQEYLDQ